VTHGDDIGCEKRPSGPSLRRLRGDECTLDAHAKRIDSLAGASDDGERFARRSGDRPRPGSGATSANQAGYQTGRRLPPIKPSSYGDMLDPGVTEIAG
jgi:hypothetical protein